MKRGTVKVKAWTVVVFNEFISNCQTSEGFSGRALFFNRPHAQRFVETFKEGDGYDQEAKVVPCTITYSLPAKKKRT
jgi:hypothetical protein